MSREILSLNPISADRRLTYGSDVNQFFDIFEPSAKAHGAVIMIHGGFWRSRYDLLHASHLCKALSDSGYRVASLEYRRVGETHGGWPSTFQDVVAGFHVASEACAAGRPAVIGHSAGGQLALLLASEVTDIGGVVALAPVAVLQLAFHLRLGDGAVNEFLGGPPHLIPHVYEAACPSRHGSTVPRTLIHGTADDVVPIEVSRAFRQARDTDAGTIDLVECSGGHLDVIDPKSHAWDLVLRAVQVFV